MPPPPPRLFDEGFEIFEAACAGDLARLQELVEQGADPRATTPAEVGFEPLFNASHYDGPRRSHTFEAFTPLMAASGHGHAHCVAFLASLAGLEDQALCPEDEPMRAWTPLAFAAFAGQHGCVDKLLELGANPWPDRTSPSILALASSRRAPNIAVIESLLAACPDAARAFHPGSLELSSWPVACSASGQPPALRKSMGWLSVPELRRLCPENLSQDFALSSGNSETLRLSLLWMDPDLRLPGQPTLLMRAAESGDLAMINALLPWFDPLETFESHHHSLPLWPNGADALGFAASGYQQRSAQAIERLIQVGARAQATGPQGWTPLMLACGASATRTTPINAFGALTLLRLGQGMVDAQDRQGNTAAMLLLKNSIRSFFRWIRAEPPAIVELMDALCMASNLELSNEEGLTLGDLVQLELAKIPGALVAQAAASALERRSIAAVLSPSTNLVSARSSQL